MENKPKLKRDDMAEKYAKLVCTTLLQGETNNQTKKEIREAIQKAYTNGFDFAADECKKENSRSGEDMYWYLTELELDREGII